MVLLPSNISRPRTTASTKKRPLGTDVSAGGEPLAVWGPAFKLKVKQCFFGLFLFVSLAQQGCPHHRDLGQGSVQPLSAPWPSIPRMWEKKLIHIVSSGSGRGGVRGSKRVILPQSHKSKQVFRMSHCFLRKGSWGARSLPFQQIKAKMCLHPERLSFCPAV